MHDLLEGAEQLGRGEVALSDLYRFDRFTAPAALWDDVQQRFPALLAAG